MKLDLKRLFLFNNLLTALLPIVCIGLLSLAAVKNHLRAEMDCNSEQFARAMVSEINTYIHEPVGTINLLTRHLSSQKHSSAELCRLLDQVIASHEYFDAIFMLDNRGIVQQAGLNRAGQQIKDDFIGMDFAGVDICRQAQSDRKTRWASAVSMISGEPNMSFCTATDNGAILAMLRLDKLSLIINEASDNKVITSFVVEKSGRIIVHPYLDFTRKKENISNLPLFIKSLTGTVATDNFTMQGVAYRGTAIQVPELDWVLVAARSMESAMKPLQTMQLIILAGIFATALMAFILGSIGSHIIRRPFILLNENARKVIHEEYDSIEPLVSRCVEVNMLSETLQSMIQAVRIREELLNEQTEELMSTEEQLRELNHELEAKVKERTAQLETANNGLLQREQSLEIANRQLEAFAYSVSHDLRAPLRHVSGFAAILLEDYGAGMPEEEQKILNRIAASCLKMDNLIKAILAFSKASRQDINKTRVNSAAMVREIYAELRAEGDGRQVDFKVAELPSCLADPLLIRQVFTNLLGNALKYTRQRELAVIEVGARQEGAETVYFVKDNGVGFDSSSVDKLFGVFERLHSDAEFEGSGVGLAIAANIIQRHGGRIWTEAAVGEGATFYFTLPE